MSRNMVDSVMLSGGRIFIEPKADEDPGILDLVSVFETMPNTLMPEAEDDADDGAGDIPEAIRGSRYIFEELDEVGEVEWLFGSLR